MTPNDDERVVPVDSQRLDEVLERLVRIEETVVGLALQRRIKEWYSTSEVAVIVGKSDYTVREYCRHRRIRAEKRRCGRGRSLEWIISHEELERLRNYGLLPLEN